MPEPIFHFRADYTSTAVAYRTQMPRVVSLNSYDSSTIPAIIAYATTTSFANQVLDISEANKARFITWPGYSNYASAVPITFFWRIHTNWAGGAPAAPQYLLTCNTPMSNNNKYNFWFEISNNDARVWLTIRDNGTLKLNNAQITDTLPTNSVIDLAIEFYTDGTVTSYVNGTQKYNAGLATLSAFWNIMPDIVIGSTWYDAQVTAYNQYHLEEFAIFDTASALTHTTTSFGANRSTFLSSTARDFSESADPGIANVLSGTSYTIQGESLTGTLTQANYTDPGIANVLSGTSYVFNNSTLTGTYNVATGQYTDPGIANVRLGTNYIFAESTLTGTLSVPTAADGPANTIDLANIKTQIKYVLEQANTTTASPVDLSAGLNVRIKDVVCIRPDRIPMQPSFLPLVTAYIEEKDINFDQSTRAADQLKGKRVATVRVRIAGLMFENIIDSADLDESDDQIERLMENIELTLRAYADLGGSVSWQFPERIQYFTGPDEETLYRVGLLDLQCRVHY